MGQKVAVASADDAATDLEFPGEVSIGTVLQWHRDHDGPLGMPERPRLSV